MNTLPDKLAGQVYRATTYPISRLLSGAGCRVDFIAGFAGAGTGLLGSLLDQSLDLDYFSDETPTRITSRSKYHLPATSAFGSLCAYRDTCFQSYADLGAVREDLLRHYTLRSYKLAVRRVVDKSAIVSLTHAGEIKEMFGDARFILLVRDAVANIEGLLRKWPLFQAAPLEDVCRFWADAHLRFISETRRCAGDVLVVSYEELVNEVEPTVQRIAAGLGLPLRRTMKPLASRPNQPGKGVRNIDGGTVNVVRDTNRISRSNLSPAAIDAIIRHTRDAVEMLATVREPAARCAPVSTKPMSASARPAPLAF